MAEKKKLTKVQAIKAFFEQGEGGRKIDSKDFIATKQSMTPDEWTAFGEACAEALGVELQESS